MVGRHVERPQIFVDRHPRRPRRHEQAGDPLRIAVLTAGAGEGRAVRRDMHAGDPHLAPVDPPAVDAVARLANRARLHMRRVRSMVGLGQPERRAPPALEPAEDELGFLLLAGGELLEHLDEREVADDAVLVLEVVVEAQPLRREMLADHRHPEVRAVLAAVLLRRREAPVPRRIGLARRLLQELLPLLRAAGPDCPSRSGCARAGGRRSGYCRRRARAA